MYERLTSSRDYVQDISEYSFRFNSTKFEDSAQSVTEPLCAPQQHTQAYQTA
eukprot:m.82433 g.82433  ORF g.82433 m.82433 type:complete len:52 (+) comp11101_c0_seq1:1088-1243(+)